MYKLYCIFLMLIGLAHANNSDCYQDSNSVDRLINSFKKFADKLSAFFDVPLETVRYRHKKISDAFRNFLKESMDNDKPSSTMLFEDDDWKTDKEITEPLLLAPEMIVKHGKRMEIHTVRTTDGYHLTLHRIPLPPEYSAPSPSKIVLLHHGLLGSSDDWLLLGPDRALPYLLSNEGYDVWLANARGNRYSRAHVTRRVDTTDFWKFSFHEIGHYDLAATIDYIRKVTDGSSQINFIGHCMGATALLVLLSTLPQYNPLIRSALLLAPLAFMYSARGPLRLLAEAVKKHGAQTAALKFLRENEFMKTDIFPKKYIEKYCVSTDEKLCQNPLMFLATGGKAIANETMRKLILEHAPSGGSSQTIMHYCQLLMSGQFQMFDLEAEGNMKKYGTRSPPVYRLNDVTVPVAIYSSAQDWLATIPDIMSLVPNLPYAIEHDFIKTNEFSHTDFLWSDDAPKLVYKVLIRELEHLRPAKRIL